MRRIQLVILCSLVFCLGLVIDRSVGSHVNAATAPTWSARKFYLTKTRAFQGNQALNACASGYHMASLWEIWDVSGLQYDTSLGLSTDDAGNGPPSTYLNQPGSFGWIRTGFTSNDGSIGSTGGSNCNAWGSNSGSARGALIGLTWSWEQPSTGHVISSPWMYVSQSISSAANVNVCSNQNRVWCVQD
jgi:hypothetical protein